MLPPHHKSTISTAARQRRRWKSKTLQHRSRCDYTNRVVRTFRYNRLPDWVPQPAALFNNERPSFNAADVCRPCDIHVDRTREQFRAVNHTSLASVPRGESEPASRARSGFNRSRRVLVPSTLPRRAITGPRSPRSEFHLQRELPIPRV